MQFLGTKIGRLPEIYLEYVPGGSLEGHEDMSEQFYMSIVGQVLSVLVYLHGMPKPIAHRDVKPGNILIVSREPPYCKLGDFGFSKEVDRMKTICGTYCYVAPEVLKKEKQTPAVDIWSLGVIILQYIYSGLPSVKLYKEKTWCQRIVNVANNWESDSLIDFLTSSMLVMEPQGRKSAWHCYQRFVEISGPCEVCLRAKATEASRYHCPMPTPARPPQGDELTLTNSPGEQRYRRDVDFEDQQTVLFQGVGTAPDPDSLPKVGYPLVSTVNDLIHLDGLKDELSSNMLQHDREQRPSASNRLKAVSRLYKGPPAHHLEAEQGAPTEILEEDTGCLQMSTGIAHQFANDIVLPEPGGSSHEIRQKRQRITGPDIKESSILREKPPGYIQLTMEGETVSMRKRDCWLNATQLILLAGKGTRELRRIQTMLQRHTAVEVQKTTVVGLTYGHHWVSYHDGRHLCDALRLSHRLRPLLKYAAEIDVSLANPTGGPIRLYNQVFCRVFRGKYRQNGHIHSKCEPTRQRDTYIESGRNEYARFALLPQP